MILDVAPMDLEPESLLSGVFEKDGPQYVIAKERSLVTTPWEVDPTTGCGGQVKLPRSQVTATRPSRRVLCSRQRW